MDSNITASLIGVGGGFIASIITFYLGRFYEGYDQRKLEKELKKDSIYRERNSEQKEDYEFIFSLPNLKQETYLSCHLNWDTGITYLYGQR